MTVLELTAVLILLGWACSFLLIGLGFLTAELLTLEPMPLEAFAIGWGTLIGALELYHLFRPIDLPISLAVIVAGLAGLARKLSLLREIATQFTPIKLAALIFSFVVIFAIALRSTGPCVHYDTGLYGVTAIQWLTSYRVVPGVANLYGRLGFNSSLFLCVAALQPIRLGALSYRLWNGILLGVMAVSAVASIAWICAGNRNRPSAWFMIVLCVPLIGYIGYAQLVAADTDLPSTIACFIGTLLLLREWETRDGSVAARQTSLAAACITFAVAIVIKLSTVAFAAPCCLLSVWKLWSLRSSARPGSRAATGCFLLLGEIFAAWVCAGYVESGYPLYPNDLLGLAVNWKVPDASVRMLSAIIKSWARVPMVSRHKTQGWRWLNVWMIFARMDRIHYWYPLIALLVAVALLIVMHNKSGYSLRALWPVLLFGLISVAVWFFVAPDLRFIQGTVWSIVAILGGIALTRLNARIRPQFAALAIAILLFFAVFYAYPTVLWQQLKAPLQSSYPEALFPSVPFGTFQTRSGLLVEVPMAGDQCWDAPLPCTPYFNPNLELRQPPSIQSGFRSADFSEIQWMPFPQ